MSIYIEMQFGFHLNAVEIPELDGLDCGVLVYGAGCRMSGRDPIFEIVVVVVIRADRELYLRPLPQYYSSR